MLEHDSGSLSQDFESSSEIDAFHFHGEVENVAVKVANPAAVPLANRVYREAGLFVRMPRAKPYVVGALSAQVDPAADEVNDVGGLFDAIFRVEVGTDWHERWSDGFRSAYCHRSVKFFQRGGIGLWLVIAWFSKFRPI